MTAQNNHTIGKLGVLFLSFELLFFSPRYRGSKSAVIFNSNDKHRAHNFRR